METAKARTEEQILEDKIESLIAIGAAMAANCIPCFEHLYEKAINSGITLKEIRLLPESYQAVLVLFDLMEFSHQEIAEIIDISVENVKVRLHRARKKLKTILEEECRFEVDERNVLICDPVASKK